MKLKKVILVATIFALAICAISSFTQVQAATGSLTLDLKLLRSLGHGYKIGGQSGKIVWKIYEVGTDADDTIYCLKGGPGFAAADMTTGSPVATAYTKSFDMKAPNDIPTTYANALPNINSQNYRALMWILDNCYVAPKQNASQVAKNQAAIDRQNLLDAAATYAENVGNPDVSGYEFELLTDDDIDVVQQLAVWYYTNSDAYHVETFELYLNAIKGTNSNYKPLSDDTFENGWERASACQALFDYLVKTPQVAGFNYDYTATNSSTIPVEIANTSATIEESTGRYIVGPFRIENLASIDYTLNPTFTDGNNNTITDVILLNSNKTQVENGKTIKDLVGQNFYISIPTTVNASNIKFSISGSFNLTTETYWSVENPSINDQPIVKVEKQNKTFSDEIEVTKDPVTYFDLALRKFIISINGVAPEINREPQIDASELTKLANGDTTTAKKVHTKDALVVKTGDKVVYKIRVYNEGDVDGYATEVTDYLPSGLKFLPDSTINNQYGWTNPSGDGKTIKTTYLQDKLIDAFEGTTLKYKDLEIECEVIATVQNENQNLKNIAEITAHKDKDGNTDIIDRDSQPNNVNITNYGNTSQQDDDDFENLVILGQYFDLSLRKFITSVSNGKTTTTYNRAPQVKVAPLLNGETSAIYEHDKTPISIFNGNIVTYTIRVYNEGQLDGYVTEITDHLPTQLEFIEDDELNQKYGWTVSEDGRTVKTKITSPNLESSNTVYDARTNKTLLKAFNGETLDYIDVQIKCRVKVNVSLEEKITNIADITNYAGENKIERIKEDGSINETVIKDRDSEADNVVLPTDSTLPAYKDTEIERGDKYIPGQQDDDDFEKLISVKQYFDLSLRKFITSVTSGEETRKVDRVPQEDVTPLLDGTSTTAIYNHDKTPINVSNNDEVLYTIRVYNEGQVDGYVTEITDHIPEQLEFMVDDEINAKYGWIVSEDGRTAKTDITSPKTTNLANRDTIYESRTENDDKVLLKAFDGETLDYIDVQIKCKVKENINLFEKITNIADITNYADSDLNEKINEDGSINEAVIKDRDSEANNVNLPEDKDLPKYKDEEIESGKTYIPGQQDDDDFEKLVLQRFDLALRKFITGVNDKEITSRAPVFSITEDNKYIYTHPKDPVDVANGNIVTYTLRIFNEGNMSGYASEVKDDLPEGLEFLPDNPVNTAFRWKMYKEDGTETTDVSEAEYIKTDFLSKENEEESNNNLINAFNPDKMTMPDYRDLKIVFKVTEPNTSDRIIINTAEITNDSDEKGDPIDDMDSDPDNNVEGEDDIDIEKIKVKYFDLSLRKWVTESIVTYNGKTTVTKTGHKAEDDPETPAKVEIRGSRVSQTTVKFKFKIRVTNEGEIAGYAKEIIDYIPNGLEFIAKDNPKWRQEDGKVLTDQLKDVLLQPGESREVEIILKWKNNKNNMGLKTNWAEIYKDYNEYDSPDIDSTPGNNVKGEDDIDEAPVILATVTGSAPKYITLALISVSMIAGAVVLIKKFVI